MMRVVSLVALVVVAAAVGVAADAAREQFYPHIHKDIVNEAVCPFLKRQACEEMQDSQSRLDEPWRPWNSGVDKKHNCDCAFREAGGFIRQQERSALDHLIPGRLANQHTDPKKAARVFGEALHTVQDFYSHSNWVESGQTGALDLTTGPFVDLKPYKLVPGTTDLYTVQGAPPSGWSLARKPKDRVVVVTKSDGSKGKGLVTGTAPDYATLARHIDLFKLASPVSKDAADISTRNSHCPKSISMPHWTNIFGREWLSKVHVGEKRIGLNKDKPDAKEPELREAIHHQARQLAVQQTRHELCRLLHLAGSHRSFLLDAWVHDKEGLLRACNMQGGDSGGESSGSGSTSAEQRSTHNYERVQCYAKTGEHGRAFVKSDTGRCKRKNLFRICKTDGQCLPNKSKPCGDSTTDPHGKCYCGTKGLNECSCMQLLSDVQHIRKIKCNSNVYKQM